MNSYKFSISIIVLINLTFPIFTGAGSSDIGDIAVLNASKKTVNFRNLFDLAGKKITFTPNSSGGYDVTTSVGNLSGMQGEMINPYPDPAQEIKFQNSFTFTFYGVRYSSIFVWAWGNVAFGEKGKTCGCAPTINPFQGSFPDEVRVLQTPDRLTVTWKRISPNSPTRPDSQLNLFKDGKIQFLYSGDYRQGGETRISPGEDTGPEITQINFSRGNYSGGPKTEFLEYFLEEPEIMIGPIVQEFHQKHDKVFDFVVIFTDQTYPYQPVQFVPVQNSIKGIGLGKFDNSASFGSSYLQGIIFMNSLTYYPDNPNIPFEHTYNTLQLLAHFLGKRWIPYARVMIDGKKTKDLQGYTCPGFFDGDFDCQHRYFPGIWNFFMDTDASVMGGNDIAENGTNSFSTIASALRYSTLDQYLMGLLPKEAVAPFFFVSNAHTNDLDPWGLTESALWPRRNVTFTGTKVNVDLNQVVQAEGQRIPSSTQSQKQFRLAFLYFIRPGKKPTATDIAKIDNIRVMFEAFFHTATDRHGAVYTSLK